MKVKIKICDENLGEYCIMNVTDMTYDFLPEESISNKNNFKKSEVSVINILQFNNQDNIEVLSSNITNIENSEILKIEKDGWYTLDHIVIPNKKWFDKIDHSELSDLTVYYTDNKNVYKYKNEETSIIENYLELSTINTVGTTINKVTLDHFSIHDLLYCYINTVKNLLNINFKCNNEIPKDLIFKRDFIWMTINIIKYLVEMGDLEGAVIRLNRLNYCNGFCKNEWNYKNKVSRCCN